MFYDGAVGVEYREEPCRSALNRVKGMRFDWSLNPYMGCVHRCTFCYVRAFEQRADRPFDDRYGVSIRVKVNIAEVLRRELARASWKREVVAIGAATDPYQPAEGRYRLTRACIEELARASSPFSIITRGPMIVRDIDVLAEAAGRANVDVTFSIPTLDEDVWRKTEPSTAHPRQRLKAVKALTDAGIRAGVGMAPILPGISDDAVRRSIADGVSYAVAAGTAPRRQAGERLQALPCAGCRGDDDQRHRLDRQESIVGELRQLRRLVRAGRRITSSWYTSDRPRTRSAVRDGYAAHRRSCSSVPADERQRSPATVRTALYDLTTKSIVMSSNTANNHLLFTNF